MTRPPSSRFVPLILPVLLTAGCASPGPPPPPPEATALAPVVADLQLAEAMATEVPVLLRDSMRNVLFDRTLADHDLDRKRFDSLLWIVRAEPAWIATLYSRVGDILSRTEAEQRGDSEQ